MMTETQDYVTFPDRAYYESRVSGPGKFEGEPAYVAWAWDAMLEGCSDCTIYGPYEDSPPVEVIRRPFDLGAFPELGDTSRGFQPVDAIFLAESEQGFVTHETTATEEETMARITLLEENETRDVITR